MLISKTITEGNVHTPRPINTYDKDNRLEKENIIAKIDEIKQIINSRMYK